jgi:hypothetical protein
MALFLNDRQLNRQAANPEQNDSSLGLYLGPGSDSMVTEWGKT